MDLRKLHLFDRESEVSIKPPIPTENVCECTVENDYLTFAGQRFPLPPALCGRHDPAIAKGEGAPPSVMTLPAEAILLGTGTGRARVEEAEVFDTETAPRTLYRLTIGELTLFALESAPPRYGAGDTVPFDPDFSRITVERENISPLPVENRLEGRFVKEKEMDDRMGGRPAGSARGRKVYRFYIDISDQPVTADDSLCQKLFSCKGTAIFHTPLAYVVPAGAVTVTPRGRGETPTEKAALWGKVTEILDYGRMVYARIAVGGQTVVAPYTGSRGDSVSLVVDQSRLSVVDREAEIIIV